MHRKKRKQHVLMFLIAVTWLGLAGTVTPVRSQDLVCCEMWIDADGNWFGARRDCKAALEDLSPASRSKACEEIRKTRSRPVFRPFIRPFGYSASRSYCCPEVAELCGHVSPKCKQSHEYGPPTPPTEEPTKETNCEAGSNVTPTITIDLPETLNIDESPKMLDITATANVTPSSTDVSWTAQITYKATGGCSKVPPFDSPKVTGEGETFTPAFGAIYGGKLEIIATTKCGKGAKTTITRDVGGLNADATVVRNEIGTMDDPFEADDLKKIACQESRQRQFRAGNTPTLGPGGDVGIMQICYLRTVGDIWNWKTNIARGRANLLSAAAFSRAVPGYTRRGYTVSGGRRIPFLRDGNGPFPNATDFTPEQVRLEAIKRYNAGYLPDVGYWEWDVAAGAWVANPQGGGEPNYVAGVTGRNANCP